VWHDPDINDPEGFIGNFPTTIWMQCTDVQPVGAPLTKKQMEYAQRYAPLDQKQVEYHHEHIVLHRPLAENQNVRVSNLWPVPNSDTCEFLQRLAEERSDRCELFSLGKSVAGRDIPGIRVGTPGTPHVLCIAGQHPTESSGIWGMRGIADFMTSLLPDASALREELLVEIIPLVNPDGNVAGRSAFNDEGKNLWLAFRNDVNAPEPEAHENKLLWRRAIDKKIALWMNIHCYKGWRGFSEYPYDGWHEVPVEIFQDPDQARVYQACYQLAKRFSIPHILYEMNAGTAGPYRSKRCSLEVFKNAMHTLLHHV